MRYFTLMSAVLLVATAALVTTGMPQEERGKSKRVPRTEPTAKEDVRETLEKARRAEKGADPNAEAECRGAILAVLRLGKNVPQAPGPRRHNAKKDVESLPILGPYRPGIPEKGLHLPSEATMLQRLEKARPLGKGSERHNVRMVVEPIADNVDPPRVISLIGPAQIHHVRYRCIVFFTELVPVSSDSKAMTLKDEKEVLYFNLDHLHLVENIGPAAEKQEKKAHCVEEPGESDFPPLQSLVVPPCLPGPLPGEDGREGKREKEVAATAQVAFSGLKGMVVQWDDPGVKPQIKRLTVPGRENFRQGATHRLKLTDIPGKRGVELYPSLEVRTTVPRTEAFLKHNSIPVQLTQEDLDHAMRGNTVTKVIYLSHPEFQELALPVETLVSTRLDAGADPVVEATKRGAILAIVRLGDDRPPPSAPREKDATDDDRIKDGHGRKMPILGPYRKGMAEPATVGPPSEDEVMRTLERARPVQVDPSVPRAIERINVRIVVEPIADSVDPPRVLPQAGLCQIHCVHYKCIVYFDEIQRIGGPKPYTTTDEDCVEVVYIDRSHLHRLKNAESAARKNEKKTVDGEKAKPNAEDH